MNAWDYIRRECERQARAECERLEAEAETLLAFGFTPDELIIRAEQKPNLTLDRSITVKGQ